MKLHRWLNHIEMMLPKQVRQLWLLQFLNFTSLGFDHEIFQISLSYLEDLHFVFLHYLSGHFSSLLLAGQVTHTGRDAVLPYST